jgi:secernin
MNEAHNVVFVPSCKGGKVKCTYMEVDMGDSQFDTYECLLSKPFWTYGAEMGVNQNGVAIGNEAIFTTKLAPLIKKNTNVLLGVSYCFQVNN